MVHLDTIIIPLSRSIQRIKHDKKELERVKKLLKGNLPNSKRRYEIRKLSYGICGGCDGIPTKIVTFDIEGGGQLIQRYCDHCG
jgi:hypothetical protein